MPLDPATQPPLDSLFFPIGPQPAARQQIPPTRSGSKGSILSGRLAKEVTREIPNKTLPVPCATPLFVCLLVFRSPPFFRWSLSPPPFCLLEYRGRYLNIPRVCRTCSPACHVFLFPDKPLPLGLSKAEAHCLATKAAVLSSEEDSVIV